MSVLIKEMEMPKHCWQCRFHDDVDDCILLNQSCMVVWGESKRLDDCQLVEVPPHGRLIDADCCNDYFYEHMSDDMMIAAMNAINEMPTIIESEGE